MRKIIVFITVALSCVGISFASDPTDLDSLFRGMEYKPVLNDSLRDTSAVGPEATFNKRMANAKVSASNDYYVLQFESVSDFDEAQRKKNHYAATTGYEVEVVFESPFYKLRAGGWTNKKVADDKARELAVSKISALVVKTAPPKESKDKSKDKPKEDKSKDKSKDKAKDKSKDEKSKDKSKDKPKEDKPKDEKFKDAPKDKPKEKK